jgi:multidrug efflux pump subunit AcrA (membrane-fusion protein)
VLNIDQNPTMFVVNGNVVQLRRVQVGARGTSNVEITSGIKPGEQYVLVGNQNLANGDHVHITSNLGASGASGGGSR